MLSRLLVGLFALLVIVGIGLAGLFAFRPYRAQQFVDRTQLAFASILHKTAGDTIARARERAQADDWSTYAHDQRRSGLETQPTGITTQTASQLRLRWAHALHQSTVASPIVVAGSVYVATSEGTVVALDAADGTERWRTVVGGVHMTPALIGDLLLVGVYGKLGPFGHLPSGASFVALDARTGHVRWRVPLPGLVRSEPVVIGTTIYEGLAGGDDFSGCFDGRIVEMDLATGRLKPQAWFTVGGVRGGGGIWSPLATDGEQLDVGTGNSCKNLGAAGYGDSAVVLDPRTLQPRLHFSAAVPGVDDSDVGGAVMARDGRDYFEGKSGYLYVLDRKSGRLLKRFDFKPFARNGGGIGSPTGDENVVVASSGYIGNPWDKQHSSSDAGGDLVGFDRNLSVRFRLHSGYPIQGYAAFVPGVGFTALDQRLVAFDAKTGAILWNGPLDDLAYASPTVVPSGVYIVSNAGTVFAYGLP